MDRLIKRAELLTMIPLSAPTMYRHLQQGLFPRPVRIGTRHVAWRLSAVEAWMANLPEAGGEDMDKAIGSGKRVNGKTKAA